MSVNKGDRITAAQINALIDKINAEAARRGYSGRVSKVDQHEPIGYDAINAVNLNRIEIAKIYRAGYTDIVKCSVRTDVSGTPSVWDGRDLRNVIINPQEEVLAKGKRAYASQYNLLENDIDNMAAMCKCNAYTQTHQSDGYWACTCDTMRQQICSCDGYKYCREITYTCSCDSDNCSFVIIGSCPAHCSCENVWCGSNCTCNTYTYPCTCNNVCQIDTSVPSYVCSCQNMCTCNSVCKEFAK